MEHGKSHGLLDKTRHSSFFASNVGCVNFESFYEPKGLRTFLLRKSHYEVDVMRATHELFERSRFIRTLLLRYCSNVGELPNEMRKLINLRHLDIKGCRNIISMPPQIGRLACLQTLPLFIMGRGREGGIAELKELAGIRGKLMIEKLENVSKAEDARQANLNKKPFIEDLWLIWSKDSNENAQNDHQLEEEIADGLQPDCKLKTLEFSGYKPIRALIFQVG
ncbi:hypothetical protein ACLOJK_037520 [Asimina triloba]